MREIHRRRWWPGAALALMLTCCTGTEEITDEQDSSTDSSLPDIPDAITDTGEEECTPETMCFSDFPCRSDSICEGNTVRSCVTVPCEVSCGTTCCSGASCSGPGSTTICAEGEICMERPLEWSWDGKEAACLSPDDEGPAGDPSAWHPPSEPTTCWGY